MSAARPTVELAAALFDLLTHTLERRPRELSIGGTATLFTLWRGGPRRATTLAAIEGVTPPTMTALITSLERDGLVERRVDPDDGRASLVALTESGKAYIEARREAHIAQLVAGIDDLPPALRSELTSAADAVAVLAHRLGDT
ncbi:MarR family winged helix-turn-helix transcriptional regulator [Gordonia aichiensis]